MSDDKHRRFMKVYQACHEPFVRYCSAICYSKMDAEDLVQDILMSAYQKFDSIEDKGNFHHYLIRAARNRSISIWRKRKNETQLEEKHNDRMRAQGVGADTLMDIKLMYKMLDKLPTGQRDALILFEISGYSMKEIADIQKSNEGAVKTKVSRGRAKLKEMLDESELVSSSANLLGVLKSIAL